MNYICDCKNESADHPQNEFRSLDMPIHSRLESARQHLASGACLTYLTNRISRICPQGRRPHGFT